MYYVIGGGIQWWLKPRYLRIEDRYYSALQTVKVLDDLYF